MPEDKYKKIFSKNLTYYMDLRGKTQIDIINDLGINKSAISSWCKGTRLPRMSKVQLLADYLNIDISDLLNKEENYNQYFEFTLKDDSMFPIADVGDKALVLKNEKVYSGKTYLIEVNNKETLRKIYIENNNQNYKLVSVNAYYKDLYVPIPNVKILGRVVKIENKSAFK